MTLRPGMHGARRTTLLVLAGAGLALLVPLAPTTAPSAARARPHAVEVFHTQQSNNWSGYDQGVVEKGTVFQSVSGEWVVSTASYRAGGPGTESSATWAGIGGGCIDAGCLVGDPTSLIQAGTEQDANQDGTTSYSAWWEVVPAPSITVTSVKVHPGDLIRLSIADVVPGLWTISLHDVTDGQGFTQSVPYPDTMLTAEWILEAPIVVSPGSPLSSGEAMLPNLSTTQFDAATVNGHPAGLTSAEQIQMTAQSGGVEATPSAPDATGDGFDDCAWASSCPAPSTALP